ncbi:MAG: peptidylprolyl isomerase [Verrucomicrobiota bacterium]
MLKFIRKHQYGIMVAVAIVVIIAFTWFYQDLDLSAPDRGGTIYKVDGQSVNQDQATKIARSMTLAYELQQFNFVGQLDGFRDADTYVQNLLVMRKKAKELGIEASATDLRNELKGMRNFQTTSQDFDEARYQEFVADTLPALGYSEKDFLGFIGDLVAVKKLEEVVGAGLITTPSQQVINYQRTNEKISASKIQFLLANYEKDIQVSDEDIATHFDENKEKYKTPEKRQIEYVQFTEPLHPSRARLQNNQGQPPVIPTIPPPAGGGAPGEKKAPGQAPDSSGNTLTLETPAATEGGISLDSSGTTPLILALPEGAAEAQAEQDRLKQEQERNDEATHKANVRAYKQKVTDFGNRLIDDEEDLAELAQEYKLEIKKPAAFAQDTPPNELTAQAELVKDVFIRDANEVSDAIQGSAKKDYFYFRVLNIEEAADMTLDQAKEDIRKELTATRAKEAMDNAIEEKRQAMTDAIAGGQTFEEAAAAQELTVEALPEFQVSKPPTGQADSRVIVDTASNTAVNEISEPAATTIPEGSLLLYVSKRIAPEEQTDDQKKNMEEFLTRSLRSNAFRAWFAEQREAANIVSKTAPPEAAPAS